MNLQNDVLCECKFLVSRSISQWRIPPEKGSIPCPVAKINPVSHQKKGSFPYPVLILGIIPHPASFLNPVSRKIFLANPVSRGS